jgi:asparagine synthase (glutamine-hydrolysing)
MSGITGIYNVRGSSADKSILERMTQSISHRGPDDDGLYFSGNVGLGHRRLSIIDLSSAGHQPMTTEDGLFTIVHDGQIYNSPEIRQELASKGYRFRSNTDTEVILHSYREWKEECLERFNGMWSFAIWNSESNSLFCSRDRIGVKPFYYYFDGQVFIFASEIKAVLEHSKVLRRVNEKAVYNYLMWGISGDSDDTFFAGIKELSAAHYLIVSDRKGLEIRRWWNLKVNLDLNDPPGKDQAEAVGRFNHLLEDAVRIRLKSDVPIGTTLSGGLDSSSVTSLAGKLIFGENGINRQLVGDKLRTFSSCYDNEPVDERIFIEKVLEKTGAEGNYDFPDAFRFWDELPGIIRQQDEPSGIFSVYARWSLAHRVRTLGVKVILDGDGSDAVLAGHHRYYGIFFFELMLKGRFVRLLSEARSASSIIGMRDLGSCITTTLGGGLLGHVPLPLQLGIRRLLFKARGRSTDRALISSFDRAYERQGLSNISRHYGKNVANLNQRLAEDLSRLAGSIKYSDCLSAPFSIEMRSPFLDYRLIEYVFSLPATLKIRDGWTKWLLRRSMQGFLPDEIRQRKDKNGYRVPLETWLQSNRKPISDIFSAKVLSSEYIDPDYIKDNLDELLSHKKSCWELWRYINLEIWLRQFF